MSSENDRPTDALRTIKERLDELNAPVEFRVSVANHVTHLEQLAERLRTFGMEDTVIDHHIVDLFERYQTQLLNAMTTTGSVTAN
jgi:hypothetical protein